MPGDTRRDPLILAAIDPQTGKCDLAVQISYDRLQFMKKVGLRALKETAYLVPAVLRTPTAIFEGLCNDADEDKRGTGWRCYVGRPPKAFRDDGAERAPWPGQVFLVFINEERVAYNWRWEPCDAEDGRFPVEHEERFKRKLL